MIKQRYQQHMPYYIPKKRKDYGSDCPVHRGWFRRNLGYIIFLLSGFGAVLCFCAALLLTFHLLPNAIDAELDRQIGVYQKVMEGKR
jgi:hypothetical protein